MKGEDRRRSASKASGKAATNGAAPERSRDRRERFSDWSVQPRNPNTEAIEFVTGPLASIAAPFVVALPKPRTPNVPMAPVLD